MAGSLGNLNLAAGERADLENSLIAHRGLAIGLLGGAALARLGGGLPIRFVWLVHCYSLVAALSARGSGLRLGAFLDVAIGAG
jgi:hypothetical protein